MKRKWILVLVILLGFSGLSNLNAQDIEDNVSVYKSVNGNLFLQPLGEVFGAAMNSGWYSDAKIEKMGFHVSLSLKGMYAPVSAAQKTFILKSEGDFVPLPNTEVPTIFGSEDGVPVPELGDDVSVSGVWDTDFFPLTFPQLTVGSVFGTEACIRWFEYDIENFGKLKLMGWGLRHSISQYIPLCPVDIAVGYFQQSFDVGNIIKATARLYGFQVSKSFSVFCLYGGFGFESATMDIEYTYEEGEGAPQPIKFELKGKNKTRFTIGFALDLPVVKFHADYNLASQSVISGGIALGI